MFRRILIANRGEIAVRITRTLREMGIRAAAVYSEPDAGALHVREADEAYPLGGATSAESYLRGEKLLEIARTHGADAIHPGYGFLSENAAFAQACADARITFIGPAPAAIRAMGDKVLAKETMRRAGVPVVPGAECHDGDTLETVAGRAAEVGFPLLVKAAAGGGGKGMRLVRDPAELPAMLEAARREAQKAFGDGRVFLEKYIDRPRHVEFQIFGDAHGGAVHLFERECSIQRRHQKIIEETPSPAVTPHLRERMGSAAVQAARAIGYQNAGTVEFILAPSGEFYFLEVNTRLQVEHPVTEMTVLKDLVRAQVQVAAGQPLPFRQDDLRQHGHAIECRIYAEDPARGFMPSVGRLERFIPPAGPGVRVDAGFVEGDEVSTYYDPMLAKLIVWGEDRAAALARMRAALRRFVILGVTTNVEFLHDCISHPAFQRGEIDTHFLQTHNIAGQVRDTAAQLGGTAGQVRDTAAQPHDSAAQPRDSAALSRDSAAHPRDIDPCETRIPDEVYLAAALTRGAGASRPSGPAGQASHVGADIQTDPWRSLSGWRVG
ncbi:MAG: acetyl-CoA carboxylase biotin carboxylase subunit [Phycisphaerales bacterium]|nr:acetyl-CoA carboxylase biotin carboxylase subunit [Phycisphaerales bacterium]